MGKVLCLTSLLFILAPLWIRSVFSVECMESHYGKIINKAEHAEQIRSGDTDEGDSGGGTSTPHLEDLEPSRSLMLDHLDDGAFRSQREPIDKGAFGSPSQSVDGRASVEQDEHPDNTALEHLEPS